MGKFFLEKKLHGKVSFLKVNNSRIVCRRGKYILGTLHFYSFSLETLTFLSQGRARQFQPKKKIWENVKSFVIDVSDQ